MTEQGKPDWWTKKERKIREKKRRKNKEKWEKKKMVGKRKEIKMSEMKSQNRGMAYMANMEWNNKKQVALKP